MTSLKTPPRTKPDTTLWDLKAVPLDLRNAARWINWKPVKDEKGKWKKPPCDHMGKAIDPHDPKQWKSFDVARKDSHSGGGKLGIGFALGRQGHDDLVGIDFDHCLNEAQVRPEILRWVRELDSYTEITPSGDGLRVWVRGSVPAAGRRNDPAGIEVYAKERYFTVTGRRFEGSPETINRRQQALDSLWAECWPGDEQKPRETPATTSNGRLSDDELLSKARAAEGGDEFADLFDRGDAGRYSGDQSRADFALMKKLAYWTGKDVQRMESLFTRSALGQRGKWAERMDYRERTIQKAIAQTKGVYIPDRFGAAPPPNGNGYHGPAPGGGDGLTNEAMDDPHRLARIHFKRHDARGHAGLRFYRDGWLHWDGSAYRNVKDCELQSGLAGTVKDEFDRLNRIEVKAWEGNGKVDRNGKPQDKPQTRKVTRTLASNATLALQSLSLLPGKIEAPCWLDGNAPFDAREIVPTRNALVHLPSVVDLLPMHRRSAKPVDARRAVIEPTPRFFNTYSLDFDFNLDAPLPTEWLAFLGLLWPKDRESIDALQEWFGYCLTPDTSQQKILALIGPKRAGKDTIARVLTNLVGAENTAGPTLAGLSSDFGLSPLIGKPLAIVSDARISSRTDAGIIVERLLTISGEGRVDIDRKYQEAWTGKLPTRFVLISNELPRLADSSGALAARMILLRLTESFYGREDKGLFGRLVPELPGILLWAIEGWRRLTARGRFAQPKSGLELIESLEELSSPVLAFGRDRCEIGPGKEIECKQLFDAWCDWCKSAGRKEPGTAQTFGRDLHAAFPGIETRNTTRRAEDGTKSQPRLFVGIDLAPSSF